MLTTLLMLTSLSIAALDSSADLTPKQCFSCEAWNQPQTPFKVAPRTWYVGTKGLSVVVIRTDDGLILLDGALPQSVAQISANLDSLGLRLADVRYVLNSHAHFDHAGGIAALARLSGATVGASPLAAQGLRSGSALYDDPQLGYGVEMNFAPVAKVREFADGETLTLGGVTLTAHHTPGHTPGGTSWSWRSCEDGNCLNVVYGDSLNPVSAPDFRFFKRGGVVSPRSAALQTSIATMRALRCDVLVTVHPDGSRLLERQAKAAGTDAYTAFVDRRACAAYANTAAQRLQTRREEERAP